MVNWREWARCISCRGLKSNQMPMARTMCHFLFSSFFLPRTCQGSERYLELNQRLYVIKRHNVSSIYFKTSSTTLSIKTKKKKLRQIFNLTRTAYFSNLANLRTIVACSIKSGFISVFSIQKTVKLTSRCTVNFYSLFLHVRFDPIRFILEIANVPPSLLSPLSLVICSSRRTCTTFSIQRTKLTKPTV